MSTKFIIASLQNLTATVVSMENGKKKKFYSNFDQINDPFCLNISVPLAKSPKNRRFH